jgi:hypothetical protein
VNTLAPFRVGSVPYLNAAPLTRGLENEISFVVNRVIAVAAQWLVAFLGPGERMVENVR